ncbi:hypothetical protein K7432_013406 [Basidiobolus ranarum]|uniref:Uncharacterized protein n=1 Tax=Basidiobolus ranarum TaxID=34480 RepID=A0ABR2WJ94_9FUNG
MQVDGVKSQIALPSDLLDIGVTDLGLHHWLVSRVYLTRLQLWEESIEYELPVFGELTPIFVKENGQAIHQHMSLHLDTTQFEDVGQFNDYFTSEGDHAPTNLDKMETVDEFLSYLDQDLIESSTPNPSHLEDTVEETRSCQHDSLWDEDIRRKVDVTEALSIERSSIDETVEEIFPTTRGFSVDSKPVAPDSLDDFNSVNDNSPSSSISPGQFNEASEIVLQDSNAFSNEALESESLLLETGNEIGSQLQESATYLSHENTLKSHLEIERIWAIKEDSLEAKGCVQFTVGTDNIEKSPITRTDLVLNMEGEPLSSITDNSGESTAFIISNGKRDHEDLSTTELIVSNECQSQFNGVDKCHSSVNIFEYNLELQGKPSTLALEKKRNIEALCSSDILLELPLNSNKDVHSQQLPINDNSQVNGCEKANLPELDSRVQNQHENDLLPEIVYLDSSNFIDVPKQCHSNSNSPDTNYSAFSPLQGDKCALISSISANQSNLNEAPLAVPDINDVGNSSEEEPRKFISPEKLIQLNGLDYAEEKSDGGSLNTITVDDVDTKLTVESEWDGYEFNCGDAVPFLHKILRTAH